MVSLQNFHSYYFLHRNPMSVTDFLNFYKIHLNMEDEDFKQFEATLQSGLPSTFRITPSKFVEKIKEKIKKYDFIQEINYLENVYTFDLRCKSDKYNEFIDFLVAHSNIGNIQRQEIASFLPHLFLDLKSDHNVLETCAAPGSKTKNLLEIIKDGILISNDKSSSRVNVLISESQKKSNTSFIVTKNDATQFPKLDFKFDRICCDVPCSSDGTYRKTPTILPNWNISCAIGLCKIQLNILRRSLELLKTNGILIYSTCSLNPIENEWVVSNMLKEDKFELVSNFNFVQYFDDIRNNDKLIVRRGVSRFKHDGFEFDDEELKKCIRIMPHDQNTGGFFIAVIRKIKSDDKMKNKNIETKKNSSFFEATQEVYDKIKRTHDISQVEEKFISFNQNFRNLFAISNSSLDLLRRNPKLKVSYAGLKAFTESELRKDFYRIKSRFLEQSSIPVTFNISLSDFRLFLETKEVELNKLQFTPSNLFTVEVDEIGLRFSGFAFKEKAFLYIDDNHRKAYSQIFI